MAMLNNQMVMSQRFEPRHGLGVILFPEVFSWETLRKNPRFGGPKTIFHDFPVDVPYNESLETCRAVVLP